MKNMRKLFALALAVMLVMSLAGTAFATETPTTYTLTLNGAQEGHTYTAYQIFAGDLSTETTGEGEDATKKIILSNITWGSGVTEAGKTTLGDAQAKADSLKNVADAETFAKSVAQYLTTAAGSVTIDEGATSGEIKNLAAGYYLVKTTAVPNTDGEEDTDTVYTYYLMKVVANTSATIKAGIPTVDKTVDDSDVNIGDTVTFTLTATMPDNIQGYETYKMVFHDTLSAGLTYGSISSVTVAGASKTEGYDVVNKTNDDGTTTLTITFADVLTLGAKEKSEIVIKYTATIDSDAVIGTEGNPNKVYLEYSNNPNADGTGKTTEKEVKVYTWDMGVLKYANGIETNVLEGVKFVLLNEAGNKVANIVSGKMAGWVDVPSAGENGEINWPENTVLTTGTDGKIHIDGLEKGKYYLREIEALEGYNKLTDDQEIVIEGATTDAEGKLTYTTVEAKINNQAGATLPETGGMGTTLFYIVGGFLVMAAAVLLVTKKRMGYAE